MSSNTTLQQPSKARIPLSDMITKQFKTNNNTSIGKLHVKKSTSMANSSATARNLNSKKTRNATQSKSILLGSRAMKVQYCSTTNLLNTGMTPRRKGTEFPSMVSQNSSSAISKSNRKSTGGQKSTMKDLRKAKLNQSAQ